MPKNKATNNDKDFDTDRYCTPEKALRPVYTMWPEGISLDPCGDSEGVVKAGCIFDIREQDGTDGLVEDWANGCDAATSGKFTVFCNPPYSDPSGFVRRAVEFTARCERAETILLLPPSFDTEWWFDDVWAHAAAICMVSGRFHFLKRGKPDKSPRGNSVYVLHASADVRADAIRRFTSAFGRVGQVVTNRDGWGT